MTRLKTTRISDGFTLIEMTVVIALTSVVLALSAATIIALFRVERQFAGDREQDFALARLATHWRADAHGATSAQIDNGCELTIADGRTIRYAFATPAVIREVRRGDALEHRDAFVLSRRAMAEFSLESPADKKIVLLKIEAGKFPERARATPVHALTIAAAIDLHQPTSRAEEGP